MMDPNYRSSFKSIFAFFKKNNLKEKNDYNDYKGALKMTPFWKIFKAFLEGRANSRFLTCRTTSTMEIIKTYQSRKNTFKIGPYKDMVFSDSDVKNTFGISCRDEEMTDLSYAKKPDTRFTRHYFENEKDLTQKVIKVALIEAVKGKKAEDVARLLCLLLCVDLFFGTTGTRLGWKFLKYAENLTEIKKYAWHREIHTTLMESVRANYKTPYKVKGCVIALQFWLCEHTRICSPVNTYESPLFLKWNLFLLEKKLETIKLDKLHKKDVIKSELPTSERPKKRLKMEVKDEEEDGSHYQGVAVEGSCRDDGISPNNSLDPMLPQERQHLLEESIPEELPQHSYIPDPGVEHKDVLQKLPPQIITEENHQLSEELPQHMYALQHKSDGTLQSRPIDVEQAGLKDERPLLVQVIELSDDEEEKHSPEDPESSIWYWKNPHGELKGPFSSSHLKRWSDLSEYALKFKVWKTGQSEDEAILMTDAIRQFFPTD